MIKLPFEIMLLDGHAEPAVFTIRDAGPEDIDAVMQLQQTVVDALGDTDILATYEREEFIDILENGHCFIAASADGETAGFSVLFDGNTAHDREYNQRKYGRDLWEAYDYEG